MDTRILALAVPSAVILAALVWHSAAALPRRQAAGFWISVVVYGVLRGLGVRFVTTSIGASFPYEIRNPMLSVGGVSAQEVAGWAVVAYLALWIGARRKTLFAQVVWASLFLGSIAWAIEAAAIAARWWHWTVPTASRVFMNVPAIGIVDWFFVGIDFVWPFAAFATRWRWRWLTLAAFPIHFGGHLLPGIWLHVIHWMLVLIVAWLALRSDAPQARFADVRSWIPTAGLAVIVVDVAMVQTLMAGRPELVRSIIPVVILWLAGLRRVSTAWLPRHPLAVMLAIALFAVMLHWQSHRDREDMTKRLDAAIAERDRGNLTSARRQLDAIARDHPTSYAALAFSGEIDYRSGQLDAARGKFARAVGIKQDFTRGYRFLAVIDRQTDRQSEWAKRGLEIDPNDIQLRYLAGEDILSRIDSAEVAAGMAALAYEVGDGAGAARIVEAGLARWPDDARLRRIKMKISASSAPLR